MPVRQTATLLSRISTTYRFSRVVKTSYKYGITTRKQPISNHFPRRTQQKRTDVVNNRIGNITDDLIAHLEDLLFGFQRSII
jgi:hypothetical protein